MPTRKMVYLDLIKNKELIKDSYRAIDEDGVEFIEQICREK